MGEISSIQQVAIIGMKKLIESLKLDEGGHKVNQRSDAKSCVLNVLVKEKPLGNWEGIHRERTDADADRS